MNVPFDTLALAKALEATPLGEAGAKAVARAMADIAMSDVATKRDLDEAVSRLERAQLRQTIALSGIVAGIVGAFATISHFLG